MKKKSIVFLMLVAGVLAGSSALIRCGSKTEKQEQTTEEHPANEEGSEEAAYACPMHPEITGKKGDVCSKCNMALEEVKKDADEKEGEEEDHH